MNKIFLLICILAYPALLAVETNTLHEQLKFIKIDALKLAINDLQKKSPQMAKKAPAYFKRLASYDLENLLKRLTKKDPKAAVEARNLLALQKEILLANPLLNFDDILLIKRQTLIKPKKDKKGRTRKPEALGMPANWQGNTSINGSDWDNEICSLSLKDFSLKTLYKTPNTEFVGDLDLHFDANKILFSSVDSKKKWQVFEVDIKGKNFRQITQSPVEGVESYDPCYLPDGRIIFTSTTGFQGVPCVGGSDFVANIHIMDNDGSNWRRLTFDQEQNWSPTVMPNGQIMYQRWEYTDSSHYFSRLLMRMNPDGTAQKAFYGSNSYWPNTLFYARPIPGSPSKFATIVSGHHGIRRAGELLLFDTNKGTFEADGALQRIPGYKKEVVPVIKDNLVGSSWPKFLHPYPLDETYMLVSCQPTNKSHWGIYLVDKFDNILLLHEDPKYALLEPLPLRKTKKPPVIRDRVKPGVKDASVFIADIYEGPGLRGVPRGTVKKMRIYQYEYAYRKMGGHYKIGMEGPWDVRRVLGTADVYADGSTSFKIPANRPVAFQPLDDEGKALQGMRSWVTAMPGEQVTCVGCHEDPNTAPPTRNFMALTKEIQELNRPAGKLQGFSFRNEIQPLLDQRCVGCHDGTDKSLPNLSDRDTKIAGHNASYQALHPFVRRNGPEGDYHMLTPLEFHANTSELVQMLEKGHHKVQLDQVEWNKLITWIDLNTPDYGTWGETGEIPANFASLRKEMKLAFNIDEDVESYSRPYSKKAFVAPPAVNLYKDPKKRLAGSPATNALFKQKNQPKLQLALDSSQKIDLVRIPAGDFIMGDEQGANDEKPVSKVNIKKGFWMSSREISLKQFRAFRAETKNGWYDMHYKDQVNRGYDMNDESLPAIRISWDGAMAFCDWLSKKTGKKVTLPTEAQWEWACRAGSENQFSYGNLDSDFGEFANLSDQSMSLMAVKGVNPKPIKKPDSNYDFIPKDTRFNDGVLHLATPGSYQANNWGLYDMHGNVAEWTRSNYAPYPYKSGAKGNKKVIRGGSWRDRPYRATSSYRLGFSAWQRVYNVGFRIIIEEK